jgi:hypothetical protein
MLKAFNMDISSMDSAYGWLKTEGFVFVYLIVGVYASIMGSNILLKEESEKTIEYLNSLPVKRRDILKSKWEIIGNQKGKKFSKPQDTLTQPHQFTDNNKTITIPCWTKVSIFSKRVLPAPKVARSQWLKLAPMHEHCAATTIVADCAK